MIRISDPALARRAKRQLLGLASYLMFVLPLAYAVHNGWMRFGYRGLGVFVLIAVVVNLGFLLAIGSGFSRRFADPGLVTAQVVAAVVMGLGIDVFVEEARILPVMLLFTALFFGVFRFGRMQYVLLSSAAVASYAAVLLFKHPPGQWSGEGFRLELLHLMVLAVILLWLSLLGSYVAALRSGLAARKNELAAALERLKELASRDELTGLHNRRYLMEALEQQHDRARRHGEPFALCLLDLDHFKRINDDHGHGVGDEALRAFADRVRGQLRRMDIVGRGDGDCTFGRYGGEEFLLVLPYAGLDAAIACVARLHGIVHAQPFPTSAGTLRLTFSAGIANHRAGETVSGMLRRADEALYRAKSAGRDRIELAPA